MCRRKGGRWRQSTKPIWSWNEGEGVGPRLNTPEESSIVGASTGRACQAVSTPLSGFLSFSGFNFPSVLKRRKPEEVKHIVNTHYISHNSAHLILTTILEDSCYYPCLIITKWWLREGQLFSQDLISRISLSKSIFVILLFTPCCYPVMVFSSFLSHFSTQTFLFFLIGHFLFLPLLSIFMISNALPSCAKQWRAFFYGLSQ